jgi:hypothetical protein
LVHSGGLVVLAGDAAPDGEFLVFLVFGLAANAGDCFSSLQAWKFLPWWLPRRSF